MIQDTSFGTVESSLQEEYDAFGRSAGCRLMLGTRTVQHSHLDYDSKGGIIGMNLEASLLPLPGSTIQPAASSTISPTPTAWSAKTPTIHTQPRNRYRL